MHVWEQDLGRCGIRHEKGNGSWGSYQRGDALCGRAGLPYLRQSLPAAGIIEESESARGERGRVGQGRVGFRA